LSFTLDIISKSMIHPFVLDLKYISVFSALFRISCSYKCLLMGTNGGILMGAKNAIYGGGECYEN